MSLLSQANTKVCDRTGLVLIASNSQTAYRIQKSSYGPLNPICRDEEDSEHGRGAWARWDVSGHRTIYAASARVGAYLESLGWADLVEPKVANITLDDYFDDEGDDAEKSLTETIGEEWQVQGHMCVGMLPKQWRIERTIYQLRLPAAGWFIDLAHSDSLSSLREMARDSGLSTTAQLDLADLVGKERELTTRIADKLHATALDDGSLPVGIVYPSRHGNDHQCYAIWLRAVDDGRNLDSEPTKVVGQGRALELSDPDLMKAANNLRIRLF